MKFILKIFANWFVTALAMLLAPVIVLFADRHGWLPRWLMWFQTQDASLDDTLWLGWKPGYWSRVRWLWRNPAYGFGYYVLGIPWVKEEWVVYVDPEPVIFRALNFKRRVSSYYFWRGWLQLKLGYKAWWYIKSGRLTDGKPPVYPAMPKDVRVPFVFEINPFKPQPK